MAIDYISIGARIRYYRIRLGLSQQELADKAIISKTHLSSIERGVRSASLENLINLCNALGVSSDEILVDNLVKSNSNKDGDDYYVLLDCTPEEATILVKNMKDLREVLRKYTIK